MSICLHCDLRGSHDRDWDLGVCLSMACCPPSILYGGHPECVKGRKWIHY